MCRYGCITGCALRFSILTLKYHFLFKKVTFRIFFLILNIKRAYPIQENLYNEITFNLRNAIKLKARLCRFRPEHKQNILLTISTFQITFLLS